MSPTARQRLVAAVLALALAAAVANAGASPKGRVPPPTPVPPRGSLSPFPTVLVTPSNATHEPAIAAAGALLADLDTGQVLYARDPGTPRPIASVTKMMTALLSLESLPLQDMVRVDPRAVFEDGDYGASSTLGLRTGERISVENLLYALLLGSANDAAVALAIAVDGSVDAFVRHMNARARQLGMLQTRFYSPNGLDDRGRSSPRDLLRLTRVTDADRTFRTITDARFRRIPAPKGRDRVIQNRNVLLWLYPGAFGTKTGLTDRAGYCLVASAERDGRRLVAVVLDAPREPFSAAAALLEYGFEGWERRTLVDAGESAGTLIITGGTVPVVAADALEALVPVNAPAATSTTSHAYPTAAFPPAPGDQVGTLIARIGSRQLGHVGLVAPSVPPAPPTNGAWWLRAATAVGGAVVDAVDAIAA